MPLPWMKMWLEALDDTKLTRLSLAERGAWWGLLQLAWKCAAGGGRLLSGRQGLTIDEISDALHIKTSEDRQALESMIAKMEERGSLQWNGKVLAVVHLEQRQSLPPSARPEAVAERVRRHREKERQGRTSDNPRAAETLGLVGIRHKAKSKELGRELVTEERLEVVREVEKEMDKKYGPAQD